MLFTLSDTVFIHNCINKQKVAEETKAKVAKDEAIASKVKEDAQAISDDAQKDLEEALPALEAAEKSLQALNKGDIGEVKALKTPPMGVITVIETICIIKGIPPKKVIIIQKKIIFS